MGQYGRLITIQAVFGESRGNIIWLRAQLTANEDRGFGFITPEQGEDLFFHRNELQGVAYDSLKEGQQVEFEVGRGSEGRPQAMKVRLAQPKAE